MKLSKCRKLLKAKSQLIRRRSKANVLNEDSDISDSNSSDNDDEFNDSPISSKYNYLFDQNLSKKDLENDLARSWYYYIL